MKNISQMSQIEYERFMSSISSVLRTQRRFIKIERENHISPFLIHYIVKKDGEFYRYLVSAMETNSRIKFENRGFII